MVGSSLTNGEPVPKDDHARIGLLSEEQSWELLANTSVARLATSAMGSVDIVPINYAIDRHTILFRSPIGVKLLELTLNEEVALEIDAHNAVAAWSVVLKGKAHAITNPSEIAQAEGVGLVSWVENTAPNWVRIIPTQVSGRHFSLTHLKKNQA
jgi:nitroimidazol reductase NimA-like FMN-containing flavoprotein (pyridoxamine 5'-phosphate oxidase superfamily)